MTWELWIAFVTGAITPVAVEMLRTQVERRQRQQDRRDDFQRETLLDLQEAIYSLSEALQLALADYRLEAAGKPPRWQSGETGWILNSRNAIARISLLTARTSDEQVRTLMGQFREAVKDFTKKPKTAEEAEAQLETIWQLQKQANDRIGQLLGSM